LAAGLSEQGSKRADGGELPAIAADPTIKSCLLNPEHPGYAHAEFSCPIPLAIDPRFSVPPPKSLELRRRSVGCFSRRERSAAIWIITVERATQKNSQLAAARRVALKMGRLLRCSSVTYRSRYAPLAPVRLGPPRRRPILNATKLKGFRRRYTLAWKRFDNLLGFRSASPTL
jgi:hypothetical protein